MGGLDTISIYSARDFDYASFFRGLEMCPNPRGNKRRKRRICYLDLVAAFDIETTRLLPEEQSVMYHWQLALGPVTCITGRTWEDWLYCLHQMEEQLPANDDKTTYALILWVHNLSYEFQFLRGIYHFAESEVFAVESRRVLKCTMYDGRIEYRCSAIQTNMSLELFTQQMGAQHAKVKDFVYDVERYPWTPIEGEELRYCIDDVVGLVEAITEEMRRDGDTLATIPLTSTGYVRRDVKRSCKALDHRYVPSISPDWDLYTMLREAFRGGNTHASRYYAGEVLHDVQTVDRSSSYPDVICNCEFPVREFFHAGAISMAAVRKKIIREHKALVGRFRLRKVRLREREWPCPYLTVGKCRMEYTVVITGEDGVPHKVRNYVNDNGRILSAYELETTLTDIDLQIVVQEYACEIECLDCYYATYGPLPAAITDVVRDYYYKKTTLKGVPGSEEIYMKSKNKLNSIYGMMATDPVKYSVLFKELLELDGRQDFVVDDSDGESLLAESTRKAFVAYQWGVWTTAWARLRLEEGIRHVYDTPGAAFVYTDTDSVKYMGAVDWEGYNMRRIRDSVRTGSHATDPKGEEHFMGVMEPDAYYIEFATLGAKKYCGRDRSGKFEITVAGVGKREGAVELEAAGGVETFVEMSKPFTFHAAGGLEAVYNDYPDVEYIYREGIPLRITSNVVLRPSTYTLGITGEYDRLLKFSHAEVDKMREQWYHSTMGVEAPKNRSKRA